MKKLILLIVFLALPVIVNAQDDVYPEIKMKIVVQEVLNAFKISSVSTSSIGKHISQEWLDENNIDLSKYNINSYSPTEFNIAAIYDRYVVATVSGDEWEHLLVFKFTDEDGVYRLIPKGLSPASGEYIDPWYVVSEHLKSGY